MHVDLSLQDLCAEAREAGACSIVDEILEEYSSVQDLLDRNPERASEWAYWYALNVIEGRWLEAESVIMQDPKWAYQYAHYVIEGRWPEAESVIITSPWWAYLYARHVIKGRWPEVEAVIMTSPEWAHRYARYVIKDRWPEAGIACL